MVDNDYLSILNLQILDGVDDDILGSFQHFSAHDDFIEYSIDLVKVEHDVQFADIPEVLVQVLHEEVDELYSGGGTSRWRSSLSLMSMQTAK
jgi:hypothetical protein